MRISRKQREIANGIGVFLAIILAAVISYHFGFVNSQKNQKTAPPKAATVDQAFNNAASYFQRSITGTVTKINGTELTIKLSSGETQQVSITKQTVLNQGGKKIANTDLKAIQLVYIVLDQTNRTQATRITIK